MKSQNIIHTISECSLIDSVLKSDVNSRCGPKSCAHLSENKKLCWG